MRKLFCGVSLTLGLFGVVQAGPARADVEFPYCAISGFATGQDCMFQTLAQCQAAVRGLGTACEANPRFVTAPERPRRR